MNDEGLKPGDTVKLLPFFGFASTGIAPKPELENKEFKIISLNFNNRIAIVDVNGIPYGWPLAAVVLAGKGIATEPDSYIATGKSAKPERKEWQPDTARDDLMDITRGML